MKVSVFGLGKLGAPLAAVIASKGHRVIGYDVDPGVMALLANGETPVREPGLADLLHAVRERLSVADHRQAVLGSDITFVVVPTPSDTSGAFSTRDVIAAARSIGHTLRDKSDYHLVVLTSTVMPGTTAGEFVPALEEAAGEHCGARFGVCYNPEFIALGSVIPDMLGPDLVLIGESDPRPGDMLEQFYRTVCDNDPPIARMSFANAEIAKLALNIFVTMKIAFVNVLADLCERLPAGDVDVVSHALGLDRRVGKSCLKGGVGYGGPCFPRDVVAFMHLARTLGVASPLAEATHAANNHRLETLVAKVLHHVPDRGVVGILGMAYKAHTTVVEASQGVGLARALAAGQRRVVVYDPAAMENARATLGSSVAYAQSVEQLLKACDVAVVMTPWDEFRHLPAEALRAVGRPKVIIDCWRIVDASDLHGLAELVSVGHGPQPHSSMLA